jgi:hypothetical protein
MGIGLGDGVEKPVRHLEVRPWRGRIPEGRFSFHLGPGSVFPWLIGLASGVFAKPSTTAGERRIWRSSKISANLDQLDHRRSHSSGYRNAAERFYAGGNRLLDRST